MRRFCAIALILLLCSCSDWTLDKEEGPVLTAGKPTPNSNFVEVGQYAADLSLAYKRAARQTSNIQDVESFLVFLAAGVFVQGAVGNASDIALANTAIGGAAIQQIGTRTVPKSSIRGIYIGAKRLNCLSTVAQVGSVFIDPEKKPTRFAVKALILGAVEEVRISTRESLVREIADFDGLVTDITPPERGGVEIQSTVEQADLDYINTLIAACMAKTSDVPADQQ
ncbi:MAG: hypothetical protein AAF700_11825 [Pseudomonadota bacterium]